jgi:multidrug efflux pump subunit AcrB
MVVQAIESNRIDMRLDGQSSQIKSNDQVTCIYVSTSTSTLLHALTKSQSKEGRKPRIEIEIDDSMTTQLETKQNKKHNKTIKQTIKTNERTNVTNVNHTYRYTTRSNDYESENITNSTRHFVLFCFVVFAVVVFTENVF